MPVWCQLSNFEQIELGKSRSLAEIRKYRFSGGEGRCSVLRLLLAADNDAIRELLQTALERDGFDVVPVPSVRHALRRIATERFDVLLSDLHTPHPGDGFTVAGAMRHT